MRTASPRSRGWRLRPAPRFTPIASGSNRLSTKATAAIVSGATPGAQACASVRTAIRSSMTPVLRDATAASGGTAAWRGRFQARRNGPEGRRPAPGCGRQGRGRRVRGVHRRCEATPPDGPLCPPRTGLSPPAAGIPTGGATGLPGPRRGRSEGRNQTWLQQILTGRLRPSRKPASVDLPWELQFSSGWSGFTSRSTPDASQARASRSRWTASSPRSLNTRLKALISVRTSRAAATSP